jgi:hypothetical protein
MCQAKVAEFSICQKLLEKAKDQLSAFKNGTFFDKSDKQENLSEEEKYEFRFKYLKRLAPVGIVIDELVKVKKELWEEYCIHLCSGIVCNNQQSLEKANKLNKMYNEVDSLEVELRKERSACRERIRLV